MAMDPEVKAKWVAALRSGRYKQTTQVLRDEKGMCCLGVLCDALGEWEWSGSDEDGYWIQFPDFKDNGGLTGPALERIGMDRDQQDALVHLNDEDLASFSEIADYIETSL